MAELVIAADLMQKGYDVFRALSPHCFCDLLAVKAGRTIRVEVRTGYRSTTASKLNFSRVTSKYASGKGDIVFGIVLRDSETTGIAYEPTID